MSIIREFAKFIEPTGELEYDNTTSGLSATTIKSAIDELNTLLGGGNVGSQSTFSIYEFAASGGQTTFNLSSTFTVGGDVTAGDFITNETYKIQTTGTTDFTSIGALDSNPGTVFTATGPGTGTGTARVAVTYIPGYIQVYINGVFIASTDYTASDGQTVILTEAAEASDLVTVVVLDSFNVATQLRVINVDASAPDDSLVIDNVGDVSVTSDIKLADNGKLILGDSSDLQIYHDGSNSYIDDAGTGALFLKTNGAGVFLYSGSEALATFNLNGASNLYYDNGLKLSTTASGIDVTGSVTADGFTVGDTSASQSLIQMLANPTNGANTIHFGDGASADAYVGYINYAHDSNSMQFSANGAERLRINSAGNLILTSGGSIVAGGANDLILNAGESGTPDIYLQSGSSTKVKIEGSNGNVGIGTTTPAVTLDVNGDSNTQLRLTASDSLGASIVNFGDQANAAQGRIIYSHINDSFSFKTNNVNDRLVIDSAGNVGIGSTAGLSSPSAATTLRIGNQINLNEYDDSSNPVQLNLNQNIDSNENYIATDQAARYQMRDGVHSWFSVASGTAGTSTNIGANEKMRIDASGNLLVGKTVSGTANLGAELRNGSSNHAVIATATSEAPLAVNRKNNDGSLVNLYKDSTIVGSIGSYLGSGTSQFFIAGADTGFKFNSTVDVIAPSDGSGGTRDAAIDLGDAGGRFKDLYLSGSANIGGNINNYVPTNSGNPEFSIGSSATNRLFVQSVYNSGAQVLNYTVFRTFTSSSNANAGRIVFAVDEADKLEINDGGIAVTGGIAFGDAGGSGTPTSNTLDSYEEGTFTPTLFGSGSSATTLLTALGRYVKVGKSVTCWIEISCNGSTTLPTGNYISLAGLPFSPVSSRAFTAVVSVTGLTGLAAGTYFVGITNSGTSVNLNKYNQDGIIGTVGLTAASLTSTFSASTSITYEVA